MTKTQIFDEIVNIMLVDSATCKDRRGDDAEKYRGLISDGMNDERFIYAVRSYLSTFGVAGHIDFYPKNYNMFLIGFSVRRFGDVLYVTRAAEGSGFRSGDKIVAADGITISQAERKFSVFLYGEPKERQGIYWRDILAFCKTATVISADGTVRDQTIARGVKPFRRKPFEFREIGGQTVYLRFDNFFSPEETESFIDEHDGEIRASKNLVIDVRENVGGTDAAYVKLLSYCLNGGEKLRDAVEEIFADEINFTERNVDLRIKLLDEYRKTATQSTIEHFDRIIAEQNENRGKGFVKSVEEVLDVTGTSPSPERVFVMTDCACGSSGESFVQYVRGLDKVTVVGRPTRGILDYSNLAYMDFGEYIFDYPTSRSLAVDAGKGTAGKGIDADICIPWSPEHIYHDTDFEYVLNLLK